MPHFPPRLAFDLAPAGETAGLLRDEYVLALFDFDSGMAPDETDPRRLRVPLRQLGAPKMEVWRSTAPVRRGRDDGVAWSADGTFAFGAIQIDEGTESIDAATAQAYARLTRFLARSGYPHLLRIWNYLDAIVDGVGDEERYRRFCVGRVRGMGELDTSHLPAATAIGRRDGVRRLQVYWLAARMPGTPLENPRQVSAYRYPSQYGAQPPSFARAMLPPESAALPLMVSGTAAIVGHASRHRDSTLAQLDEIFANFESLFASARARDAGWPDAFGHRDLLKVYVRNREDADQVAQRLGERLPQVPCVLLHGEVCRPELRVEIEGMFGSDRTGGN
ncbi:MAG: pteridine-dependent deoxygenase [Xanthomonadaceae bacterium]|nr:pteridine-dependent deoxygenase [Xanthomonadaceae bacterium]